MNLIKELRLAQGLSQQELADRVGTTPQQIGKLELGRRKLTVEWLRRIATVLECRVSELLPELEGPHPSVELVGYVGAGAMYYPEPESGPWMGFDTVDAPPGGAKGIVALKVRGDSMYPVYRDGDLLFVQKESPPEIERCLHRDCVVQVGDGATYVKRLEREGNGFRLESYNHPPISVVTIRWSTPVLWVKRM